VGNPLTTMSRASFDNVLWNLNSFEFNYNNTIHNGTERYIYANREHYNVFGYCKTITSGFGKYDHFNSDNLYIIDPPF